MASTKVKRALKGSFPQVIESVYFTTSPLQYFQLRLLIESPYSIKDGFLLFFRKSFRYL